MSRAFDAWGGVMPQHNIKDAIRPIPKSCKNRDMAMPTAAPYLKPSNRQHQDKLGGYQLEQIKGIVATGKKWLWSPNLPVLPGSQSPQPKASLSVLPSSLTSMWLLLPH